MNVETPKIMRIITGFIMLYLWIYFAFTPNVPMPNFTNTLWFGFIFVSMYFVTMFVIVSGMPESESSFNQEIRK